MLIVHDLFDLNLLASLCYFSLGLNATGEFCHVGRHLARAITILPGAVAADDYSFAWHFAGDQTSLRDKVRKPVLSAREYGRRDFSFSSRLMRLRGARQSSSPKPCHDDK